MEENRPQQLEISLFETIKVRDNIGLKTFSGSIKKFISHFMDGWFSSDRRDLSPDGVYKERLIDRQNNHYKEFVKDAKTGRIIHDINQKLTEHK